MNNPSPLYMTLISTTIAMMSTIIGSSCIFFSKKNMAAKYEKFFFGIISGMMLSSLVMSIIFPTIRLFTLEINNIYFVPAGVVLGIILVILIDKIIFLKNYQIILSSSLRNLIEGISIGIAFSLSKNSNLTSAMTLSLAMILQNFLESLSISLIFRNHKIKILKLFLIISIPGFLEPLGGAIGVTLSENINFILPLVLTTISTTVLITLTRDIISEFLSGKFVRYTLCGFVFGFVLLLFLDKIIK